MKIAVWALGFLLTLSLLLLATERLASERVEVVELHTIDETGSVIVTRLWVVDDEGYPYIRVSNEGSGWFSRLQSNQEVRLTRNNVTNTFRPILRPEKSDRINQLMREKYSWGDAFIGLLVGGRQESIPVELHQAQ